MADIFITGHKNPDLDSIASAWAYAVLKNQIDSQNNYIPVRCGHMNEATRGQFARLGVEPIRFMRHVRTKVADVVLRDGPRMQSADPVFNLVTYFGSRQAEVVPIFEGDNYIGLLSLDEITDYFLRENGAERPRYLFHPDNFHKVLQGECLKAGKQEHFEATLMTGARKYDQFTKYMKSLEPDFPLLVVSNRKRHIQFAIDHQFPAIILTGMKKGEIPAVDYSNYQGSLYSCEADTAEAIRLLRMSLPVRYLLQAAPPEVDIDELFDDAKRTLVDSGFRGLPVFEDGHYVGYVTGRSFLERPLTQVIMVDHNEFNHSIDGIEEAQVLEIIDHHRLGAERTREPIFIASEPVGSTCTIVYHQFLRWSVEVDPLTARMLLSGITSDTVMLKSPTTTDMDRLAVEKLSAIAKVPDYLEFAHELFSGVPTLVNVEPKRIIEGDFKTYADFGIRFGIGQVEVTTLQNVDDLKEALIVELKAAAHKYALDWAMLMITDVIAEESILLSTPFARHEKALIYPMVGEGTFILPGVLSRKIQLLPEILRVLEESR